VDFSDFIRLSHRGKERKAKIAEEKLDSSERVSPVATTTG
jgi:hypothetical protein